VVIEDYPSISWGTREMTENSAVETVPEARHRGEDRGATQFAALTGPYPEADSAFAASKDSVGGEGMQMVEG